MTHDEAMEFLRRTQELRVYLADWKGYGGDEPRPGLWNYVGAAIDHVLDRTIEAQRATVIGLAARIAAEGAPQCE